MERERDGGSAASAGLSRLLNGKAGVSPGNPGRFIIGIDSGMPGLGDVMTDDEIWDVLSYIRSTWPDRIRKIQAGRNPPHRQ